jgi:diaminohydroxyphosphoribosylaminopyrimidine deaminase/5-amino-6-(5-phosphoribosylamino)uracil reductase
VADSGVARVVVATGDPNPLVNGSGLDILRGRGISVTTGVLDAEARALNAPFFSMMTRQRPFITMKVALSADHRIAIRPGVRTPLTGPAASRIIHRDRAEVDAIAVGSGTVLADDPVLTPRGAFRYRPLVRVVFDSRLRTPPESRLFSTLKTGPVIIVSTRATFELEQAQDRIRSLTNAGAEILAVERDGSLVQALKQLHDATLPGNRRPRMAAHAAPRSRSHHPKGPGSRYPDRRVCSQG